MIFTDVVNTTGDYVRVKGGMERKWQVFQSKNYILPSGLNTNNYALCDDFQLRN